MLTLTLLRALDAVRAFNAIGKHRNRSQLMFWSC